MGAKSSKVYDKFDSDITISVDYSNKYRAQNKMLVIFFQVKESKECFFSIENFPILLGEYPNGIPKYSVLENTEYPYLFCADHKIDIKKVCGEFGFEIGFYTKQLISEDKFNSLHKTTYIYHNIDRFDLVPIK